MSELDDKLETVEADATELAARLEAAWTRYVALFGEQPRGTLKQLTALCTLLPQVRAEEKP